MNAARRFTYRFLSLPYHTRIKIADEIGLIRKEDAGLHDIELFKRFFRRAREEHRLEELQKAVDQFFKKFREEK